jgi:two-component system, OmpR family, alkaline phosphatase synthesis response regulator PhoP
MNKNNSRILIVDDEESIVELLEYNLSHLGYMVQTASNGLEAIEKALIFKPELILMDLMMPKMSGVEACKLLRSKKEFDNTKIIFLTAMGDEFTEITCLDAGAEDYIVKPIKPAILASRIKSQLRRVNSEHDLILDFNELVVNKSQYSVTLDGTRISFARKEFELLFMLAAKPGKVFDRNVILNEIWGSEVIVGDRTIDVHIRKIRQKLNDRFISTVKGVGYKFEI